MEIIQNSTKCLHKKGEFIAWYHMSIDALKKSRCSCEAIDVNMIAACGLRWLGGEAHKTNADAFYISIPSSERVVQIFILSVLQCKAL
jgi:hypothetical protein